MERGSDVNPVDDEAASTSHLQFDRADIYRGIVIGSICTFAGQTFGIRDVERVSDLVNV